MPQQNLLRAILVGLAWTVAQCVVYLIVFELGRGRLWIDVLSIPDPVRAFFWQNYTSCSRACRLPQTYGSNVTA